MSTGAFSFINSLHASFIGSRFPFKFPFSSIIKIPSARSSSSLRSAYCASARSTFGSCFAIFQSFPREFTSFLKISPFPIITIIPVIPSIFSPRRSIFIVTRWPIAIISIIPIVPITVSPKRSFIISPLPSRSVSIIPWTTRPVIVVKSFSIPITFAEVPIASDIPVSINKR